MEKLEKFRKNFFGDSKEISDRGKADSSELYHMVVEDIFKAEVLEYFPIKSTFMTN